MGPRHLGEAISDEVDPQQPSRLYDPCAQIPQYATHHYKLQLHDRPPFIPIAVEQQEFPLVLPCQLQISLFRRIECLYENFTPFTQAHLGLQSRRLVMSVVSGNLTPQFGRRSTEASTPSLCTSRNLICKSYLSDSHYQKSIIHKTFNLRYLGRILYPVWLCFS